MGARSPDGGEVAQLPVGGWSADKGEFLLDYDDVRQSAEPEATLLSVLVSAYEAGSQAAGWAADVNGPVQPA